MLKFRATHTLRRRTYCKKSAIQFSLHWVNIEMIYILDNDMAMMLMMMMGGMMGGEQNPAGNSMMQMLLPMMMNKGNRKRFQI